MIRPTRGALVLAFLLVLLPASREGAIAAGPPAPAAPPVLTIGGLVGRPLQLTADALRKLPSHEMPGDLRGGRDVSDLVTIEVK